MNKQTVLAVLLIFLFAVALLTSGLHLSEMGLQEVGGRQETPGALRVKRGEDNYWVLIFAGESWQLPFSLDFLQ